MLFTGGRGSSALSRQLLKQPGIRLTLAINGYDDGASTGEVRRFLGDSLGPSDFRKNASHVARELGSCRATLIDLLDLRLPPGLSPLDAADLVRRWAAAEPPCAALLEVFFEALASSGRPFRFDDCSVGNLVFAGAFLHAGRRFNCAVDQYCGLVGLPAGLIDNVTGGENAYLVAIGDDGALLGSEEEIVTSSHHRRIHEVFLIEEPLNDGDRQRLGSIRGQELTAFLNERSATVTCNERLSSRLAEADLILYAPGTQHSSLFPSYLTPGLGPVIARNVRAIKALITNLHVDAEIADASATEIIERALFYMNGKGRLRMPAPCLITDCLVNDPGPGKASAPYVTVGPIQAFDESHAIRIANYEDGVSGRHDAEKILSPFFRRNGPRVHRKHLVVMLDGAGSVNKTIQTLLEIVRGGIADLDLDVSVVYVGDPLGAELLRGLPFAVSACRSHADAKQTMVAWRADVLMLFEASGMYRGEDVAALAAHVVADGPDAIWGSRRLSVREIDESIGVRYRQSALSAAISRVGSHVLSLACLALHGRYISDTLTGVRAFRLSDGLAIDVPLSDPRVNQHLLSQLLLRKADVIEVPIRFCALSPEVVRGTTVFDGLHALAILVHQRLFRNAGRGQRLHALHHQEHG
ncbi:MAG: 2-phospho-L-lactate transferase CofD family protein [Vicinamibacterales bacterium]